MLVSVIIPTYNRAGTIERAVNSVLAQSWRPLEVIIVDDGSTDRTAEILAAYGDRIRLIQQQNQGPSGARNTGIQAATGEIISFLDSDDSWLPDKTERQVRLLQATESLGVKCCVCNARIESATRTITSFASARLYPGSREGIWTNPAEVLTDRFLFFNQVVAVRREVLEQTGYFRNDLPMMEDYDLSLRVSLMGPWAFIADPLVVWHGHTDNRSQTHTQIEICLHAFQILEDLSRSSKFGPLLPQAVLRRRLRLLSNKSAALHRSVQANPVTRLLGKCQLLYIRVSLALTRRLPFSPRMITRSVIARRPTMQPGQRLTGIT